MSIADGGICCEVAAVIDDRLSFELCPSAAASVPVQSVDAAGDC